MDRTVPIGAALLLDFIYRTEVGKGAPGCYNVIFGNRQSRLAKPLTSMTLAEVQARKRLGPRRHGPSGSGHHMDRAE